MLIAVFYKKKLFKSQNIKQEFVIKKYIIPIFSCLEGRFITHLRSKSFQRVSSSEDSNHNCCCCCGCGNMKRDRTLSSIETTTTFSESQSTTSTTTSFVSKKRKRPVWHADYSR